MIFIWTYTVNCQNVLDRLRVRINIILCLKQITSLLSDNNKDGLEASIFKAKAKATNYLISKVSMTILYCTSKANFLEGPVPGG